MLGREDNWIRESHLFACLLVNPNIQILKSLRDSWGFGAWGFWQYKSFHFELIVYWEKHPAFKYTKDDIAIALLDPKITQLELFRALKWSNGENTTKHVKIK